MKKMSSSKYLLGVLFFDFAVVFYFAVSAFCDLTERPLELGVGITELVGSAIFVYITYQTYRIYQLQRKTAVKKDR